MRIHQEIFDKAVTAIIEQGEPSFADGFCYYRSPEGLKCVIGHVIPDHLFQPDWEGDTPMSQEAIVEAVHPEADPGFLDDLQECHDCPAMGGYTGPAFVKRFKEKAHQLALKYNLNLGAAS